MSRNLPVVFVHGLFGFGPKELGPLRYWGTAFLIDAPLERHEASVGPISSAHDRACELAAQIKGTVVDYGEKHASAAGHERFGRDRGPGFVPDWSERRPVHLVGHSLGSPTIRCLQHLLAIDYWGWGSNSRWVSSVTTISGVSNGSTATYFFGADERTGLIDEASLGQTLFLLVEVFMYATHAIRECIYDFDLGQWGFHRRPGETLEEYLTRVSQSRFMAERDNACYSLTLQGAYEDDGRWETHPDTYYFSHVTEQTFTGLSGRCYPEPTMDPALVATSTYIGSKDFDHPPIPGFRARDWWENDGLVSAWSQMYPRISGTHPVGGEITETTDVRGLEPGRWYYETERSVDHLDVCIFPQPNQIGWQRRFYARLFDRLQAIEAR